MTAILTASESPGEQAFDRCLLPFAISLLLDLIGAICFLFLAFDADISSWHGPPRFLWPVVGAGFVIYWLWSLGEVLRSWHDPQSKMLRFASLAVLFMLFLTCVGLLIPMPLIAKAARGDVRKVKALLAQGTDVNAADAYGMTLLHWAADKGHKDVVELLLAHGANVNAKELEHGISSLQYAAMNGHVGVMEVLLGHGADVSAKDNHGTTALEWAAMRGQKDAVNLLLSRGADVNTPGLSALHTAAGNGHKDVVELLLAHGANVNAKDKRGRTPLDLAKANGQEDVIQILLAHGAELNAKDK